MMFLKALQAAAVLALVALAAARMVPDLPSSTGLTEIQDLQERSMASEHVVTSDNRIPRKLSWKKEWSYDDTAAAITDDSSIGSEKEDGGDSETTASTDDATEETTADDSEDVPQDEQTSEDDTSSGSDEIDVETVGGEEETSMEDTSIAGTPDNGLNAEAPAETNSGGGGAKWPAWPSPTGSVQMGDKIKVGAGEVFDGGMKSYKGGQFRVSGGGTLQNIIIEDPSEDISVHCSKGCILKNVWWPNLGDFKAAEFQRVDGEQNSQKFLVEGGGVEGTANRRAFVFNAVGQLTFRNFQLINWTRGILCNQGGASCKGNNICRSMVFENVRATGNRDGGWFTLYNNAKIDSATNLVFDKADEGEFAICRDDTTGARAKDAAGAGSCGINPGAVSFV